MNCFKIKKGKHSSKGIHFGFTFKNTIKFICWFDPSCLYQLEGEDKYDINKLYGFSTSWNHHKQSARIGWRCVDGESIEIVTYSYVDGVRIAEELLGIVRPLQEFECEIQCKDNYYVYKFFDEHGQWKYISVSKPKLKFPFKYFLFPYYGGNQTAPHDMQVFLKRI